MTPLTDEQVKAYLDDREKCPCCGGEVGWSPVEPTCEYCKKCMAEWKQVYTLTSITLTSEPKEKV